MPAWRGGRFAGGAPSGWGLEDAAEPLVPNGYFFNVSCTSASACTAVGWHFSSSGVWATLAEARDGTSWKIQTTPNPARATYSLLDAVSCTSASACVAVGFYTTPSGRTLTLAERWNGTSWQLQATPSPKRVATSELTGVSCASAGACMAVGSAYTSSSGKTVTLAEAWDGTSWKIQTIPSPARAITSDLSWVSCTAGGACQAVGNDSGVSGVTATLAEVWDGTSWKIRTSPDPAGATYSALSGVSCTAATACMAVGSAYISSSQQTVSLAEAWNGTTWAIQPSPKGDGLSAVSCASPDACSAVGSYAGSPGRSVTRAETWNGTSWKVQATPNPAGATRSYLLAESCTAAGACVAAGYSIEASGVVAPLAEGWDGTIWTIQATPDPTGTIYSALSGVSCASASACTAVGSYNVNTSDQVVTLAEVRDGTTWTIQATPNPTHATTSNLSGVSCPAADACTAVGYYINATALLPLAEAWNGTTWTTQKAPAPAGAGASELAAVSCASASACTAVGYYTNSAHQMVPLAEAWNGTTWTIRKPPVPAGAGVSELSAVSCTSADACQAVGFYYASASRETLPLAEAWNGATWKVQAAPDPVGATYTSLQGVSCTAAGTCTAVGSSTNTSGATVTLAEARNGTTWTIQPTPDPTSTSKLSGVSCTAAGACTAVGSSTNTSGATVTLAEARNGTTWTIQATPNPAGSPVSDLSGVSCTAASACTAAGYHTKPSGVAATLAEAES